MKITSYLFKKNMARYLVIFSDNHNEEFDVDGFKIMTEKEVNLFEEIANNISWEFEFCANSECFIYANGEEFLTRIEFKEITKEVYDALAKTFGGEFGTFIGVEFLKNILDGEEDSNNEIDDDDDDEITWSEDY
jgi:hypothetical protein